MHEIGSKPEPEAAEVVARGVPEVDPYFRGKICAALALGLSQREAAAWFAVSRPTISRLLETDPEFAAKMRGLARLALLRPLLRVQQAAGKSWRAAAWLSRFLASRQGQASPEDLAGMFPSLTAAIRRTLFEKEVEAEAEREERRP